MWRPLDADLSSPWVLRRFSPVISGESDSRRTFRAMRLPTVSPADPRSELGPRSLDPDRPFWSAYAELIRGQTSPTDFCNCVVDVRATKPGLSGSSQGRRPRSPSFSSTRHAASLAGAVARGEPRSVRWRRPQCWFFSLARVCPAVMPPSPPHLRGLRPRSIVRIDVHGSEDRAKDASPCACDDLSCLRRVHAHRSRMLTAFPSSASSGHPLSSARLLPREDTRGRECGPTKALVPTTLREEYRLPEDRDAFHRHDARRNRLSRRNCSLRPSRRLSRSRRPHFVPS